MLRYKNWAESLYWLPINTVNKEQSESRNMRIESHAEASVVSETAAIGTSNTQQNRKRKMRKGQTMLGHFINLRKLRQGQK